MNASAIAIVAVVFFILMRMWQSLSANMRASSAAQDARRDHASRNNAPRKGTP